LYGILAHLDAGYMWDCAVHCLDLAPFAASLLVPLLILWEVDHKQVIEVKQIIDPQQVHGWNQDLPLAKEKVHSHVLA